jgi:hypothetical protein
VKHIAWIATAAFLISSAQASMTSTQNLDEIVAEAAHAAEVALFQLKGLSCNDELGTRDVMAAVEYLHMVGEGIRVEARSSSLRSEALSARGAVVGYESSLIEALQIHQRDCRRGSDSNGVEK